jgi:hypothetical protein
MRRLLAVLSTLTLAFWPAMSRTGEMVELCPPQIEDEVSVEEALLERRLARESIGEGLT